MRRPKRNIASLINMILPSSPKRYLKQSSGALKRPYCTTSPKWICFLSTNIYWVRAVCYLTLCSPRSRPWDKESSARTLFGGKSSREDTGKGRQPVQAHSSTSFCPGQLRLNPTRKHCQADPACVPWLRAAPRGVDILVFLDCHTCGPRHLPQLWGQRCSLKGPKDHGGLG